MWLHLKHSLVCVRVCQCLTPISGRSVVATDDVHPAHRESKMLYGARSIQLHSYSPCRCEDGLEETCLENGLCIKKKKKSSVKSFSFRREFYHGSCFSSCCSWRLQCATTGGGGGQQTVHAEPVAVYKKASGLLQPAREGSARVKTRVHYLGSLNPSLPLCFNPLPTPGGCKQRAKSCTFWPFSSRGGNSRLDSRVWDSRNVSRNPFGAFLVDYDSEQSWRF